jgi:hypothetical protein
VFNAPTEQDTSSAASGLQLDRQWFVQLGVSVVEKPQGAAGGTAVGHVAGLCAVMLTRLHAVPH